MLGKTQATNVTTNQSTAIQDTAWWMRVVLGVELCLTDALRHILHNYDNDPTYTGLTDDEVQLYKQMVTFKKTHKKKLCKVIHEDQWNILCPSSGRSDSSTWDITLIIVVIRYCTDLPPPQGGWEQKSPQKSDTSKAAFVLRSRKFRNDVKHGSIHDISTKAQFLIYWGSMETLLKGLNYTNMILFYDLETGTLKMYTKQMVKALEEKIDDVEDQNNNEIETLKNQLSLLQASQTKNDEFMKMELKRLETDVQALKLKKDLLLPTGIYWNVYQSVHNFVDRKETFLKIESIFSSPNQTCDHVSVVIHGLGGVGKTEVAANYAKVHKDSYDNVIWLDCENIQDSVKEFFTSCCYNNGQSSVTAYLNAIYTALKDTKCLFILDNIQDYNDAVIFFRNIGRFRFKPHFVMTTQNIFWDSGTFQTIDLSVFSKQESISFILEAFPLEKKESIEELVNVLECFPLALQQARAYIQKQKISISCYIKHFKEHNSKILGINLVKYGCTQYKKTLLTVWEIAFQKIKSDEASLAILGIMAYMDGKRINKNIFLYHKSINQDEIELNKVIDILTEYSLVQVRNIEKYNILIMHSLVQELLQCNLLPDVFNYFAETVDLLYLIACSNNPHDPNNLWYVHAKFILMQIDVIEDNDILRLSSITLTLTVTRMDFDVSTHIISLVTNMSDLIKENVDANVILPCISNIIVILMNRKEIEVCKQLLSDGIKIRKNYNLSNYVNLTWNVVSLSYYLMVHDVKNIQSSYKMIKDSKPLQISEKFMEFDLYKRFLEVLRGDLSKKRVIFKKDTELLNLVNESISNLGSILDIYGYKNDSLVALYFYCILLRIEFEIYYGEDKEDDLLVVEENLKLNSYAAYRLEKVVRNRKVLNFSKHGKCEKALEMLRRHEENLLNENTASSAFLDHEYNAEILLTRLSISVLMLKLGMYKEANKVITKLYENEAARMCFTDAYLRYYTLAKIMCNEIDIAIKTMKQIPIQSFSREKYFINLNNYLCYYTIKQKEFNNMKERLGHDPSKLKILLEECIQLRQIILTLCKSIISVIGIETHD